MCLKRQSSSRHILLFVVVSSDMIHVFPVHFFANEQAAQAVEREAVAHHRDLQYARSVLSELQATVRQQQIPLFL